MVILFSNRKSKTEKEIIEILKNYGGDYISDNKVTSGGGKFTIISEYKKTNLDIKNGIAVFCDDTERFIKQILPKGVIGICENENSSALKILSINKIPTITCGMNCKNTVTFSSYNDESLLTTIQRTIISCKGSEIEPTDFKIKLTKNYTPFSIMAATAVLLLNGITPNVY